MTGCLMLLLTVSCQGRSSSVNGNRSMKVLATVPTTPVKDQGKGTLCWDYAMLATLESEHLAMGDSVNLSPAFVARMMLKEKAQEYYFSKGTHPISLRGMIPMTIHYIQKYGASPYDSYPDKDGLNLSVLTKKIEQLAAGTAARGKGLQEYNLDLEDLLDDEMGYMPGKSVFMMGAEYTHLEFAHSVCAPGEYLSLTSFTHHPFGESFVLETPDNQMKDSFYNIPLPEFMQHIHDAVMSGHPVCWEGDISNNDFKGDFVDTSVKNVNQEHRQRLFEQLTTTDDHAMTIVGLVEHDGKRYYRMKNSWGSHWRDHGYVYLSEDYIALNTIAIVMSKAAYEGRKMK